MCEMYASVFSKLWLRFDQQAFCTSLLQTARRLLFVGLAIEQLLPKRSRVVHIEGVLQQSKLSGQ